MKKRIPFVLILLAAAAAAYWWWGRSRSEDPSRIAISGNLELKQYEISFKTAGRLVELTVDEGDEVKKGALLARIGQEQLQETRNREAAGLQTAKLQAAQLDTAVAHQRETNAAELELRRAEVAQAQAGLNELLAGSRPQEIQQARANAEESRSQHQQAVQDWERAQQLFKNDDISRAQFDQFRTRFESTRAALRHAEERLALITEGPRKEAIDAARAQVSRAQAGVKLAEALGLALKQREQEAAVHRSEIERARLNVAVFDTQIAETSVYAPADGVVLVRPAELGEVVAAGTSVLTIGDLAHPWLRGYISETQLGRVKLGQKARLKTDSFPDKEYWGTVTFIAPDAEFTPKQIQTKEERVKLVYRVKIDVENSSRELKANMPVDAEILTGN